MKLLSTEDTKQGAEKRLNEAIERNLSILRRVNKKLDEFRKAQESLDLDKKNRYEEFKVFVKDIQVKKTGLLKELAGIERLLKEKRDIIDALTEKEDELIEREFGLANREAKLKEREKFAQESESRAKELWERITKEQ